MLVKNINTPFRRTDIPGVDIAGHVGTTVATAHLPPGDQAGPRSGRGMLPIPMKPPLCSEMIAPPVSGMISPPV